MKQKLKEAHKELQKIRNRKIKRLENGTLCLKNEENEGTGGI